MLKRIGFNCNHKDSIQFLMLVTEMNVISWKNDLCKVLRKDEVLFMGNIIASDFTGPSLTEILLNRLLLIVFKPVQGQNNSVSSVLGLLSCHA